MTTKGAWGFIINKKEKIIFIKADAYPNHLGIQVLDLVLHNDLKELEHIAKIIKNTKDKNKLKGDYPEFYTYGKSNQIYISNQNQMLHDSLFCQYAYIINIDTSLVEIYTGDNQNPKAYGRYASKTTFTREIPNNYYGVVLRREIPFESIWQYRKLILTLYKHSLMKFFEGID